MASELPKSEPASPKDEDPQVTQAAAQGPDLPIMITKGEDERQRGDVDVKKEQDSPPSTEEPRTESTSREKPAAQTSPKTDGALRILKVLQCTTDILTCQFNDDGSLLAVGLSDGSIKVYSTDKWDLLHTLKDQDSISSALPISGLCFSLTSERRCILMASYSSGSLKCWYVAGRQRLWWLQENSDEERGEEYRGEEVEEKVERQTLCLALSPSGEKAVTGGSDSAIHLHDLSTLQTIQVCTASSLRTVMDGHSSRIFAVTFHPETETEFISGGWDNTVQFWDTRQQNAVRMLYGPHVCGESLHIDPVTNQILSGSWRKEDPLEVWDYSSGKKVTSVPPDPHGDSLIYACRWFGPDHIIAGGCQSNTLRVIDRHSLKVKSRLFDLPSPVVSVSISPPEHGPELIAATCGKQVFILAMDQ